jgi:hypothetical protein
MLQCRFDKTTHHTKYPPYSRTLCKRPWRDSTGLGMGDFIEVKSSKVEFVKANLAPGKGIDEVAVVTAVVEFICDGNWKGKHTSLSRGAGAKQPQTSRVGPTHCRASPAFNLQTVAVEEQEKTEIKS